MMRSNDEYIDKPDDFSRKVGEKLREHRMPVDAGVWDSLAGRFPPREKRIPAYWPWAAAGVAAVALALLFLLGPRVEEPLLTQSDTKQTVGKNKAMPGKTTESAEATQPERAPEPAGAVNRKEMSAPEKATTPEKTFRTGSITTPEAAKIEELTGTSEPAEIAKSAGTTLPEGTSEPATTVNPAETPVPAKSPEPEKTAKPGTELLPAETLLAEGNLTFPVREKRGLASLTAALGSGGIPLDFSFGNYDMNAPIYDSPFPGSEAANPGNPDYLTNVLTPGDYTDIGHRPPVTFSLTADFSISKDASVETGLSYTYLYSLFNRNDNVHYRGTLRQHYIGVPVNLRYRIWQNRAWDIYLFGGGSIEKGLLSIYKQEIEQNGDVVLHTDIRSSIRGFQFSAQGGAGFSYRLQDNLSLFGEPRLIYYFKNNQPMSARTENPLVFGLNMGVRIEFNAK